MKNCDYTNSEFGKKCKGGKVSQTARVWYNDKEQDVFYLCDKCAEILSREAQSNRWKLTLRKNEFSSKK